ncbi:hypothetical protein CIHG_08256 [Coccidioides immitis H538.4]|uniref:Uncharacterized protein n=1 Tax=Coccidioides immitis H538.4 TaxID=396776 RepID=A0A0J8S165_COCIT|nr:hypothetical protein CIHG_08256 [Coccidioides immitis H538.4]
MVLDYDQPSQSASGFGDDAPMSDSDPYFSSQKGPHSLFAKFPTNISLPPFTFGRRLLHWTQSNYETKLSMIIRAQMDTASAMVNRFPSQEETDAIVEQASMLFDIPEAAGLAGGSLGLYLGGKPTNFDPKDAEVVSKLTPIARMRTSRMVHVMFFLPLCFAVGYWVTNTVAQLSVGLLTARDQRMSQFQKDFEKQDPKEMQKRLQKLREEAAARRRAFVAQKQQQRGSQFGEDASHTGGYLESGNSSGQYGSQPGDSKILSEVYSQPNGGFQQQSSQQPQYYRPSQPSQGQSFWDDDASPTNPEVDATPQTSSASAWERIRQSAATQSSSNNRGFAARRPPQQEQQQQQQSQQPSSGDDWRSSDYGAGRDYGDKYAQSSREQAQRDFDKLIDREREFGSDKERDSGRAWGKRW